MRHGQKMYVAVFTHSSTKSHIPSRVYKDDAKLRQLVAKYGSVKDIDWYDIAIQMGKSRIECQKRYMTFLSEM